MKPVRLFLLSAVVVCAAAICGVALVNARDTDSPAKPPAPAVNAQSLPSPEVKAETAKKGCDDQDDDDDAAELKSGQAKVDTDDIEDECEDDDGPDGEKGEHERAGEHGREHKGAEGPHHAPQPTGKVEPHR